jgi:single-strand DNA-binding protein
MATLNKVMLIGRLTKDPEPPRTLPSGGTVVKFRFAVGRSRKNEQGGWDKDPNQLYIDCEAFSRPDSRRNLPELITKYAKQGDPLFVEGRLVFEEWDDKQTGQKRSKHKLVVDSIEFLGGRGEAGEGAAGGPSGGGYGGQRGGGKPAGRGYSPPADDDDHGGGADSGGGDGDPIPF